VRVLKILAGRGKPDGNVVDTAKGGGIYMEVTTAVQLKIDPSTLNSALVEKTVNLVVLLDKYGEQVAISLANHKDEGDSLRLMEAKEAFMPNFEVFCVLDGVLMSNDGDHITLEQIPALLAEAEAERIRFYTERAAVYGPSAWPQ
jgi:hypothetical protein